MTIRCQVIVSTRRQLPTITPKMKLKIGNSEKAEKEKNDASKQDGIRMNLKANRSSSAEEEAESIAPNQDRLQRKLKRVRSSGEGKKSNQNVVQKKLKLDSPNLEPTSQRAKEVARMKIFYFFSYIKFANEFSLNDASLGKIRVETKIVDSRPIRCIAYYHSKILIYLNLGYCS